MENEPCLEFPMFLVCAVLGNGTLAKPRALGTHTYQNTRGKDERSPLKLTMEQVGDLFRWAWIDASDPGIAVDELVPGATRLEYALDHRSGNSNTLRDLIAHCAGAMKMMFAPDIQGKKREILRLSQALAKLAE